MKSWKREPEASANESQNASLSAQAGEPHPSAPERRAAESPVSPSSAPPAHRNEQKVRGAQEQLDKALDELQAAKQRAVRDTQRQMLQIEADLIAKLFPVLDGLDRSLSSGPTASGLLEGVKLVREQLEHVLVGYGLERVASVGEPFDPNQHEAVDVVQVDQPSEHHTVIHEWEAGYRLNGRLLRAAKVQVGKLSAPGAREA